MSVMGGSIVGSEKPAVSNFGGWEGGFGALSNRVRDIYVHEYHLNVSLVHR
jgi:hypothetical protein